MQLKTHLMASLLILILVSGCSIVPYEDEFACDMPSALGKCQNMEDAYKEATTGISTAPVMVPASQQEEGTGEVPHQQADEHLVEDTQVAAPSAYERYIEDYYSQLQRLIVSPKHPVIRQPTQVRMLVLPYASNDQSVMYMARHIYWVHKQPQYILGDYMRKPAEILDNPMMPREP